MVGVVLLSRSTRPCNFRCTLMHERASFSEHGIGRYYRRQSLWDEWRLVSHEQIKISHNALTTVGPLEPHFRGQAAKMYNRLHKKKMKHLGNTFQGCKRFQNWLNLTSHFALPHQLVGFLGYCMISYVGMELFMENYHSIITVRNEMFELQLTLIDVMPWWIFFRWHFSGHCSSTKWRLLCLCSVSQKLPL